MLSSSALQLPPAGAAVDRDALARLAAMLDPDGSQGVVPRVLGAYETALRRTIERLDGDADAASVVQLAHTLKSSSGSIGALALAEACAAVEARWRGDGHARPPLADDIALLRMHAQAALASVVALRQG